VGIVGTRNAPVKSEADCQTQSQGLMSTRKRSGSEGII
jgi:hypothetical protein